MHVDSFSVWGNPVLPAAGSDTSVQYRWREKWEMSPYCSQKHISALQSINEHWLHVIARKLYDQHSFFHANEWKTWSMSPFLFIAPHFLLPCYSYIYSSSAIFAVFLVETSDPLFIHRRKEDTALLPSQPWHSPLVLTTAMWPAPPLLQLWALSSQQSRTRFITSEGSRQICQRQPFAQHSPGSISWGCIPDSIGLFRWASRSHGGKANMFHIHVTFCAKRPLYFHSHSLDTVGWM